MTDLAFREFPTLSEGSLAKLRAAIVNMGTLAVVASEIGLGEEILLGRGEELSGGRAKASILADAWRRCSGRSTWTGGSRSSRASIKELFWPRMEAYVRGEGDRDYKTILQERAAQDVGRAPEYRVAERGPDHMKEFTATVYVAGQALGVGTGRSKKEAEQQAAREAFARMTGAAIQAPAADGA